MQIQLEAATVQLGPNQTLRVVDGAGSTVCAVDGAVWITEENQPRDIVLEAGGCYQLRHDGVAIVNPLAGGAFVSLK